MTSILNRINMLLVCIILLGVSFIVDFVEDMNALKALNALNALKDDPRTKNNYKEFCRFVYCTCLFVMLWICYNAFSAIRNSLTLTQRNTNSVRSTSHLCDDQGNQLETVNPHIINIYNQQINYFYVVMVFVVSVSYYIFNFHLNLHKSLIFKQNLTFTPYFCTQKETIEISVTLPFVQFILCGVILSLLYLQRQEYQNILDNEKMRKEVHDVFCKPPRIISYPSTTMSPTMLPTTFHR